MKIVDVAAKAGVSPTTVSRVLNGSSLVKSRTRNKVMQAIEELGYYPNAAAKNLRSQRTWKIGVIVMDINVSYYAEIIKGIENTAYAKGYKVLICDAQNNREKERDFLGLLMDRTIDGLILVTPQMSDPEIADLADKGYDIGIIGRYIDHERVACAYTDNIEFSERAVSHLIENGHTHIAFLSGFAEAVDSYERLEGYIRALKKHNIPFRPELIENGNFDETLGYEAVMRLFAKKVPFTAVYAANDEMALGVYKACKELGIRIPSQLALVGVDNNRIGKYIVPTLSTVEQPKYAMGARLTENLIGWMTQKQFPERRDLKIASELIIRESSGGTGSDG
ncbi:LacI family DNA-binding transcriptional regulator [Paenibacillus thermoaerophilus]|uniref:LacI family DNA-binding transcriptional regulator n=1 Tax=Paenibacillus thermoaerophilus TaxID=1215385 RepID=A0ABW2V4L2_9BACL